MANRNDASSRSDASGRSDTSNRNDAGDRDEVQSFAVTLGKALRHWGHTPFYIFPLGDGQNLVLTDSTGTIEGATNYNGSPYPPLVDDETGAVFFDGGGDIRWGNLDKLDVVDGPFSTFAIFEKENAPGFTKYTFAKEDPGNAGWAWVLRSDGTTDFRTTNDNGKSRVCTGPSNIMDGQPHSIASSSDPNQGSEMYIDGTLEGTANYVTPIDNDIFFATNSANGVGGDPFKYHVQAFTRDWSTEPQAAVLDTWARDRDNQPTIPTQLPNYITNAFGSSGPDFWWSADRHFRHKDGEGVEQLTDHAGSNFAVQRTSSDQPIARGPTNRGKSLDYIEYSGAQASAFGEVPASPNETVGVFVAKAKDTSSNEQLWSIADKSTAGESSAEILVDFVDGVDPSVRVWNDSGNRTTFSLTPASDVPLKCVFAFRYRQGNDIYATAQFSNGDVLSNSSSKPGSFSSLSPEGSLGRQIDFGRFFDGYLYESAWSFDDNVTQSQLDTLVSNLANKWGI